MLKKLRLRMCFLRTGRIGWEALASILRNPKSELVELDIAYSNSMNNTALASIADALRGNNKLKEMPLEWDRHLRCITNWKPLTNVMCDKSSIKATFDSNHTLERLGTNSKVGGYSFSEGVLGLPSELRNLFLLNRNLDPVEAARCKIIETHFSGNFSMNPFLDMETKVLPQLMAWMAKDNRGTALLYHFIRNSSIFENKTERVS